MSGKNCNVNHQMMDQITCLVAYTFGVAYEEIRSFNKDPKEKLLCAYVAHRMGVDVKEISDFYHSYPMFIKNKIEDIAIKVMVDDHLKMIVDVFIEDLADASKLAEELRNGFEV
jgi:hypothetical protein